VGREAIVLGQTGDDADEPLMSADDVISEIESMMEVCSLSTMLVLRSLASRGKCTSGRKLADSELDTALSYSVFTFNNQSFISLRFGYIHIHMDNEPVSIPYVSRSRGLANNTIVRSVALIYVNGNNACWHSAASQP